MGIGPFSYNPHPFSYLQLTLVLAFMMGIAQKSARPHPSVLIRRDAPYFIYKSYSVNSVVLVMVNRQRYSNFSWWSRQNLCFHLP